jgi:calcineurin-like phosphoesterase
MPLKILFIGDVVGSPGRKIVGQVLPRLIHRWGLDLVVCNAEDAAGGSGLTARCHEDGMLGRETARAVERLRGAESLSSARPGP